MEKPIEKRKMIVSTLVLILILALIGTGFFFKTNRSLSKNLNNEKLKTEMFLSEKLALQKEIENLKTHLYSLNISIDNLDKQLAEIRQKLNEKEAQLSMTIRDNGNIKALKKEISELTQLRTNLETQINSLNETVKKVNKEKEILNETISSLQKENKELKKELDIISYMACDDYLIETTKRNGKLTVKARCAKKIKMTFKVPENMGGNISFKITKPDGKLIDGKNNVITSKVVDEKKGTNLSDPEVGNEVIKKIEMIFVPKEKLKAGKYKIETYDGEKHVGSCSINLR